MTRVRKGNLRWEIVEEGLVGFFNSPLHSLSSDGLRSKNTNRFPRRRRAADRRSSPLPPHPSSPRSRLNPAWALDTARLREVESMHARFLSAPSPASAAPSPYVRLAFTGALPRRACWKPRGPASASAPPPRPLHSLCARASMQPASPAHDGWAPSGVSTCPILPICADRDGQGVW